MISLTMSRISSRAESASSLASCDEVDRLDQRAEDRALDLVVDLGMPRIDGRRRERRRRRCGMARACPGRRRDERRAEARRRHRRAAAFDRRRDRAPSAAPPAGGGAGAAAAAAAARRRGAVRGADALRAVLRLPNTT